MHDDGGPFGPKNDNEDLALQPPASFTDGTIRKEARAIIERAVEERRPTLVNWITHEVLSAWPTLPADFPGSDRYQLCAQGHVRRVVGGVVQKYRNVEKQAAADRQMVLPGYERLQRAYNVVRRGEETIVPLELLTTSEIDAKIEELEQMAVGCMVHAQELKRYRDEHHQASA